MAYEIRRLPDTFAAEVAGLDLHQALDGLVRDAIWSAFATHHVLVFRDQALLLNWLPRQPGQRGRRHQRALQTKDQLAS